MTTPISPRTNFSDWELFEVEEEEFVIPSPPQDDLPPNQPDPEITNSMIVSEYEPFFTLQFIHTSPATIAVEAFPEEIMAIIGNKLASIPTYPMSDKKITEIQTEYLLAPILTFTNSKEGYSGIILNYIEQIEIYYGDKSSFDYWNLTVLSPKAIKKNKSHILNLQSQIETTNIPRKISYLSMQIQIQLARLEAQFKPISFNKASFKEKLIESLL